MSSWLHLLLSALLLSASPGQQTPAPAPAGTQNPDSRFFAVSYVEVMAPSAGKAVTMLTRYREASAKQDGFVSFEAFEQIGRPGHFAVFEVWRDQQTFDARDGSAQKQLLADLQPIRVSGYDQRPYKALAVSGNREGRVQTAQVVVTHVDVAPNPQVPVLLRQLADDSRKEPGNLRFDVVQHTMRANHFTVIEAWRDQRALDAHVAAPHTRQYRDTLQPMTGSPLDERVYKAID